MVFHPLRNSFSGCFAIVFLLWLVVMATAGLWMWEIGNAFLMRGRLYKEPPPILDIKAESQYDARHYHCIGTSAVPERLLIIFGGELKMFLIFRIQNQRLHVTISLFSVVEVGVNYSH